MITLYHGGTLENLKSILKEGFDPGREGTGWGTTYGSGIYLTSDLETARAYSDSGKVLEVTIKNLKTHKLNRMFRPGSRHDQKILAQLKVAVAYKGINCLVTPDAEEYIVFGPVKYGKMRLI